MGGLFLVFLSVLMFCTGAILVFEPEPHSAVAQVVVLVFRILGVLLMIQGMRMIDNLQQLFRIWSSRASANENENRELDPLLVTAWQYYRRVYGRDTSLPVSGTINTASSLGLAGVLLGYGAAVFCTSIGNKPIFHVLLNSYVFIAVLFTAACLELLEMKSSKWMRQAYGDDYKDKKEEIENAAKRVMMSPLELYNSVRAQCSGDFDRPWKAAFLLTGPVKLYWLYILLPMARYGIPLASKGNMDWIQGIVLFFITGTGTLLYLGIRHVLYKDHSPENYPYPCWYFPLRMLCADIRKAYAL